MDLEKLKQELKRTFSETPLLWIFFFAFVFIPLIVIIVSRALSGRPMI